MARRRMAGQLIGGLAAVMLAGPVMGQPATLQQNSQLVSVTRPVTVRYSLTAPLSAMSLSSDPQGSFNCESQAVAAPPPGRRDFTCTASIPRRVGRGVRTTIRLQARYVANVGAVGEGEQGAAISGAQWGGACAGTTGEVCTLSLLPSDAPVVEIAVPS